MFVQNRIQLVQVNLFQKLATSAEHVVYQNCSECQNKTKTTICAHNMFCRYSELAILWTINNLWSYCGLNDAKISASDTDLPVLPANKHDCCYKVIQFEIIGLHRIVKKNIMDFSCTQLKNFLNRNCLQFFSFSIKFWKNEELWKTVRPLSTSKIWLLSSSGPIMCVSVTLFSLVFFLFLILKYYEKWSSDALEAFAYFMHL